MSPIEQLKKKLKDLANQGSNVFSQKIVSPVPQRKPIQPQDNIVSQFGRSSVGKAISGFQKNIEQQTLPKVNFTKQTNTIQNPTVRTVANFGATAAQEMANLPQRLLEGGGRIGTQVVRPIQEGRPVNTRQAVGAFASAAEPILDIATLGSGIAFKQAAKQGLKAGAKYGVKRAILRGVATGAGYGAAFGGLRGLSEGREASFKKGFEGAAQGAVIGGALGGVTSGASGLIGKLTNRTPEVEKQLRDSMGRWTRGVAPIKPRGMAQPAWDFQLKFNKQYKRNPYTPVYADDVKKAVGYEVERRGAGLSIRDINKDKNPLGTQKLRVKPQVQIKTEIQGSNYKPGDQKVLTQPGSYINTRADQIAPKMRKPAPFEVEMDAQVGKQYEKPFLGRSKLKLKEPTKLPGDQATADFATARAAMGGNGVKGLPKETSDQFQKWVNTRRATQLEGVLKKKEFADLNNKGIEGIFEFQSGNKTGRYGDVKKYFDTKYKTLQDNKIEFDFRQDYLPQLWNNTPEEINQVMGRRMGMKPSFTLDAVFKSYKEGIDAGLTPKFQNISDLVGWYEQKANKAIADKNFFDFLGKDGTILPSTKAPMEWETLDPDRFPKFLTQIADEKFAGTYKAPKEVADVINGYLRDPQMPLLEKVANYVSGVKSIALNFGIPGTAINAHGINILARHSLMGTGGNPISRFVKGAHFMLDQRSAGKMLDKQMVNAPKAMKDGLMLSSDDYSNRIVEATGLKQKFGKKWEEVFGGPLFNKMLPSLKLSSYEELVKNGMDGKDAAKLVNNVYGGINWEQMGRSKDIQNLLRIAILAPDWAETTLRTGGNFIKALNPKDRSMVMNRYRTMMATILGSYVAHNVANKLTSGHYSFENEPSNIFNIQVGYTEDGEKRYIRPYGTGLDMVRLPAEVAMGLFKGDLTGVTRLLRNRLSIPAGVALGALTDQDYRGNAIGYRGTDKFGNEMPMGQRAMNIGTEMASLVGLPSFIKQFGMSATGQQSMEAGLTQAFELPTRYQNPGKSKTQEYVGRVSELKGKDLYDLKTRFKGEAPFSDNQKALINQGGLPALDQVMQLREQKRQVNKSKDIQEKVVNGEITEEEGKKALEEILKTSAPVTQKKVDSTNKAYASDTVTGSFSEDIAKNRVKLTKKSERLGNKIIYPTEDGAATIDLTPPTKGTGIGAYANKDWNITKARSIWNNEQVTKEDKDYAFKQLGVKPEDVRYDALADYSVDIKTQDIMAKSKTKEKLIENIKTGRKRSIGDKIYASDDVINNLVDEGRLTKEEGKELKAIDYDKSGKLKIKAGGKGRKLKIGSTPTMKAISIGTPSKMAKISFEKKASRLQLKARPAKRKVKLKKLQAKRQKASKLKIKSLKSANV